MNGGCRYLAAAGIAAAFWLTATPDANAAYRYCGKVKDMRVYSTRVACLTARHFIRAGSCPARWTLFSLPSEFEPNPDGFGCRRGNRRFYGSIW